MKLDIHGIRFRLWLVFTFLAVGITLFIGALQTGLISPYYRNSKIRSVQTIADSIQKDLLGKHTTREGISSALRQTVNNNACVVILNEQGKKIYEADSIGAGCVFREPMSPAVREIIYHENGSSPLSSENREYSVNLTNARTGQEMIVYGRQIRQNLSNYYMYVNSPLEPVDSVVQFFTRQYGLYTVIAVITASLAGLGLARTLSDPIVKMRKEAQKLAAADYSADFDGGTFSETKLLASTLNNANNKLSKIEEMRRDLIANVSHDIRTPLTDIRAYAEMIRDISGDNPEKREKHLDVIIRETEYMNRLVNDMSELSKMQSGNETLHFENVDLSELIRDVVDMDQKLAEDAGVVIHTEIPDHLTVFADELKITQVVANYLSNAIKYTPEGKNVYVRAWTLPDEETVRIEVADEGEGISAEELPYIWDRYQKSSRSFSRKMTSTGLGLNIVKAIADLHHASYGVTSKEGEGSTFWFELKETHEA